MTDWSVNLSAECPHVAGEGYRCMVCTEAATGHMAVTGGAHDGRFLALLCPRHASEEGWGEVKDRLVIWMSTGLLARDGGPGPAGAPEVEHHDHWDALPTHAHGEAADG